jgi:hypothetical protein
MKFASFKRSGEEHRVVCPRGTPTPVPSQLSIVKANFTWFTGIAEMQNYVFLLNADKTFQNMIPPARARVLQSKGKASVFRLYPYVLILKEQVEKPALKGYRLKIDPGSIGTGFAIQCSKNLLLVNTTDR